MIYLVPFIPHNEKIEAYCTDYVLNTNITHGCDHYPSLWAMYSGSITRTTK